VISDHDLALLCAATEGSPAPTWTFQGPTFHATLNETPDGPIIACQGSVSIGDWIKDFEVFGHGSIDHPALGLIHAGFDVTTSECLMDILKCLDGNRSPILTGHSKGGAEAEMLAAKLAVHGIPTKKLTTFGTPRWVIGGNVKVSKWLPAYLSGVSYRNYKDIVTEVPFPPYIHPPTRPIVEVGTGTLVDLLDPPKMHSIVNYAAAITN
jgi:hypothetical protein